MICACRYWSTICPANDCRIAIAATKIGQDVMMSLPPERRAEIEPHLADVAREYVQATKETPINRDDDRGRAVHEEERAVDD
jgi:hypothetical protein